MGEDITIICFLLVGKTYSLNYSYMYSIPHYNIYKCSGGTDENTSKATMSNYFLFTLLTLISGSQLDISNGKYMKLWVLTTAGNSFKVEYNYKRSLILCCYKYTWMDIYIHIRYVCSCMYFSGF